MADDDKLLGGEYELIDIISSGTTTQIWEAKKGSQTYAIKKLIDEKLKDSEAKGSLKYEASICRKLDHPHIVRGYDFQAKKTHVFFVMERVTSPSLKSLIRGRSKNAETLDLMAVSTMAAIADAAQHMHEKGYLHRDIKPDNILSARGGDTKLIDFSLAGKPDSSVGLMLSRKKSRKIMGTRTYIAPEMVRRDGVQVPADIYSFGITLYEMLTGRPPFMGNDPNALLLKHVKEKPDEPSAYNPNISPAGDEFVLRLLKKNPKDRPQSMEEVSRELKKLDLWKEPPNAYYAAKRASVEAEFVADGTLDSRADAERDPNEPKKVEEKKKPTLKRRPEPERPAEKPAAAPQPPPQPAAAQQGPPPGYPPMPAGQMPPGYGPPPGYPQMPPGQMPPGQMPPGYGMPPGQAPPGYPPMPPGQMPPGYPQPPPQQTPPGYGPPPGQGGAPPAAAPPQAAPPQAQPSPPRQPPAAPQPSAPQPTQAESADDDLPVMTELPDVS